MLCSLFLPFLAALVEVAVVATPLVVAVFDDVAICPSSTRLMSSCEAGVLTPGPTEQVGGLKIWMGDLQQKGNCPHLHLPHRMLQRIGAMKIQVAGATSSPSSSAVVFREASDLLNIGKVILIQLW